jgi:hypothetical protein
MYDDEEDEDVHIIPTFDVREHIRGYTPSRGAGA